MIYRAESETRPKTILDALATISVFFGEFIKKSLTKHYYCSNIIDENGGSIAENERG
jgi:hypothetical protein